jgi:hypothetical protein
MARAPPSLASAAVIVDVTLNTQLPDLLVPSAKLYRGKDLDPLGLAV